MGHTAGTLLEAGLPVDTVFSALKNSTNNKKFIKLYFYLADGIDQGKSFNDLLRIKNKFNKILPTTVTVSYSNRRKVWLAVKSSFMQISRMYEEKVDTTSKNSVSLTRADIARNCLASSSTAGACNNTADILFDRQS
jgi:hypothetical protein